MCIMRLNTETFEKWKQWMEVIISDLMKLANYKQIYDGFAGVMKNNQEHIEKNNGMYFCEFVQECYFKYAALCIRRHMQAGKKDGSLLKTMKQIKECAPQFTYDRYLEFYPVKNLEWQKGTFMNFSKNGEIMSDQLVDKDISNMEKIARVVSDYIDRTGAHLDPRGFEGEINYGDIKKSINLFDKVACKYITLITSKGCSSLRPIIQSDWQNIFTVPLDNRDKDIK